MPGGKCTRGSRTTPRRSPRRSGEMEAGAAEAGAAAAAPANSGAGLRRRNRSKHAARAAEDAVTSQGGDAGTFMLWLADRARGNPRRKAQLSRFQMQAGRGSVDPRRCLR